MKQYLSPVIKWSGSKRSQAKQITSLFPKFRTYYEPFLGSGSVLIQAHPTEAICSDICKPLIDFWNLVKDDPCVLIEGYTKRWEHLQNDGYLVYYKIRDQFNDNPNPIDLLFLSRTCVNGLIRFNRKGNFNNSLHHTRKGINPKLLEKIILRWSELIQNYQFVYGDYTETTKTATSEDFVYLDPPYFHTIGRYYGKIDYDKFIDYLDELNSKNIRFVLSLDGRRENRIYLFDLPARLFKRHLLLDSGNASFKKVMDKKTELVKESIYLNY